LGERGRKALTATNANPGVDPRAVILGDHIQFTCADLIEPFSEANG
jgi:hypothetical protein